MVHRLDFSLESNFGRKFVIEVFIVRLPVAPTVTITNPAAVGATARLGADLKRRQPALFILHVSARIWRQLLQALDRFATTGSSHSWTLRDYSHDCSRALWCNHANLPHASYHPLTVSKSVFQPRYGFDP